MNTSHLPITVQMLTRNSAENLEACLAALADFDEILIQDGYSTDGTREVAKKFPNVRLLDQDRSLLDADGRIINFAAMRNIAIKGAKNDWILMMDSDEIIPAETIEEIGSIVRTQKPGIHQVFRRFVIDGVPVVFAAGYPAYQIRLYHRSCVEGYVKEIHERLNPHPGVVLQTLKGEILVPQPPPSALQPKYDRYLAMEIKRLGVISWGRWFKWLLWRNLKSAIGLTIRSVYIRLILKPGLRMPWAYEWQYMKQGLRLAILTCPFIAQRQFSKDAIASQTK